MSLVTVLALMLAVSLTFYGVLAGVDFGAGILGLQSELSVGAARGRGHFDRLMIATAIGPLWEANHVWLIFSITVIFSAFPRALAAIGTGLFAPITVVLLALVVRGVALGARGGATSSPRISRGLSAAFGAGSALAPFGFGAIAGGLAAAASSTPAPGRVSPAIPWSGVFALLVGALAVALCTQLAAAFIAGRCAHAGEREAAARFRRRAVGSAGAVLLLMVLTLVVAAIDVPSVWQRLSGPALPALVSGLAAQMLALGASIFSRPRLAHFGSIAATILVLWGWFIAQTPHLVGTQLTLHASAAAHPALVASALAAGAVLAAVVPAFVLLWFLFSRSMLEVIE